MKKIILIVLFWGATNLFAQQQQDSLLVKEIPTIKENVYQEQQEIDALTKKVSNQNYTIENQSQTISALQEQNTTLNASIDSLRQLIQTNRQNIVTNSKELRTKIQETERKVHLQIAQLDNSVEKNLLYWIIATLATLLLGSLIYWLLGKRIASSKTNVESQIRKAKVSLEEEGVKLDNKLIEMLEAQLKIINSSNSGSEKEADHTLALKVADEIIRIQKNLTRMDKKTKGLKQLTASVKRIQDNFVSNGYEIVEMLGKPFNDGMKVSANFVPNEDLEAGQQIITRIIKPQVNYKGVMIQSAQIEVSQG